MFKPAPLNPSPKFQSLILAKRFIYPAHKQSQESIFLNSILSDPVRPLLQFATFHQSTTLLPFQDNHSTSSQGQSFLNPNIHKMSTATPKTSPYKASSIFSPIQNAIAKGIHDQNFKNGAFRTSIPPNTISNTKTSVVDAFNILLASPELSNEEIETVKYCRTQFIHLRNRFTGATQPKAGDAGALEEKLKELKKMFEEDAARREPENAALDFEGKFSFRL
jgi:hypothetical protein